MPIAISVTLHDVMESARSIRTARLAVAVGCAAAILAAVACRPERKPANVPESAVAKRDREWKARIDADRLFVKTVAGMNPQQVTQLEAELKKNPEDLEAHKKLLIFYSQRGEKVLGEQKTIAARRRHILWFIGHHPDFEPLWGALMLIFPTRLDALPDPEGYRLAKKLWLEQTGKPGATPRVLASASAFLTVADKPLAEKLLLRAQAMDPKGGWAYALGSLYYEILVGSNASKPMGVVRSVSMKDAHGPFAQQIRDKLAKSTDAMLLYQTGSMLTQWGTRLYKGHHIDFDPYPLGKSYLERARQLDPQARGRYWLAVLRRREREAPYRNLLEEKRHEEFLKNPPRLGERRQDDYLQMFAALPETERLTALLMVFKIWPQGLVSNWPEHAGQCAKELLRLAVQHPDSPEYGDAIYAAHMTLGTVAILRGEKKTAAKHLIEASKTPGSDELDYSGLDLALPNEILKWGQRDAVVEYLESCAKFSVASRDHLLDYAGEIRRGITPDMHPRMNAL